MKKALSFGCGEYIEKDDENFKWDNWDILAIKGVKKVEFNELPYPAKENTYDFIKARQVLQLLDYPDKVLHELWRITKPNGVIHVTVSYYNNKGAHNDIKTKYYFNENSFRLFCDWNKEKFELISLGLTKTRVGKILFFEKIRKFLNLFISSIYENIEVKIKVKK